MQQIATIAERAHVTVGCVPSDLLHPRFGGMLSDPGERYAPAFEVNKEQNVIRDQPSPSQHLNREEIHSSKHGHVRSNKLFPGDRLFALWRGRNSVTPKNVAHRLV